VLKCLHHPGLPSIAGRSSFLSGKLDLGKLSETIIVVGKAMIGRRLSQEEAKRLLAKFE
jgi:hypothetical protein